ncbi:MAG: PCYCGC domain-containing protein [Acidobacteriota bacterium]|nr:PCYCGC domain-containing protein [Acidobacteriota bacterium]
MYRLQRFSVVLVLVAFALALLSLPQQSSSRAPAIPAQQVVDKSVPAFHAEPPTDALPATMSADNFTDPVVQNAYTVASRVKKVLYQEPCYCHCDRSQGHGSLLDCFVSKHGSGCDICVREDLYSYEQTRKGKTPAQIRQGIIRGEWQSVDVSKYQTPPPAKTK